MSAVWTVVLVVGAATVAIKATGPVLLGGRALPPRFASVVEMLAPAVFAALVVTSTAGGDEEIVLDERLVGVGVAAVAVALRAPLLLVIVIAGAATAGVRLL